MSKSVEKKKKTVRFFKNKNKKSKKNCKTLLTLDFRCAIIPKSAKAGENLGVAQLVARYLGVVEAARSSRVTQTISSVHNESDEHSIFFAYIFLFRAGFLLFFFCYAVVGR